MAVLMAMGIISLLMLNGVSLGLMLRPSCPSILPIVLLIFTYDYKAKNEHQEVKGKSLFIRGRKNGKNRDCKIYDERQHFHDKSKRLDFQQEPFH